MPQNGTSRRILEMRRRVSETSCAEACPDAEYLVDLGELRGDQAARAHGDEFLLAGQRGAFAAGARGQRLHRHREELPERDQ